MCHVRLETIFVLLLQYTPSTHKTSHQYNQGGRICGQRSLEAIFLSWFNSSWLSPWAKGWEGKHGHSKPTTNRRRCPESRGTSTTVTGVSWMERLIHKASKFPINEWVKRRLEMNGITSTYDVWFLYDDLDFMMYVYVCNYRWCRSKFVQLIWSNRRSQQNEGETSVSRWESLSNDLKPVAPEKPLNMKAPTKSEFFARFSFAFRHCF